MNPLEMQDIIRRVCLKNNINCKVKIKWLYRSPMGYRYKENTIHVNPDRCIRMAYKMRMNIEEFLTFATYHEIGHYLYYLNFLSSRSDSKIEREIAAWKISRDLVPESIITAYDEFNRINLESYRKKEVGI